MNVASNPDPFATGSESSDMLNYSNTSTSNLSTIASDLAIDAGKIPKRLCCPFCLFDFGFEFLLKSHIQESHSQEVKLLSKTNPDTIRTDICCYCGAKFYIHGLLPKHVIRKHQECILGLASSTSDDAAAETVGCSFCPYKASSKQIKLLFIHLENKHLKNVDEMLSNFNTMVNERTKTREYIHQNDDEMAPTKPEIINPAPRLKPILKRGSLKSDCCGILNETVTLQVKQRKLRFNLPAADSSFTSVGSDKENLPLRILAKRTLSLRIKKQTKSSKPLPIVNQVRTETRNVLGDITDVVHENLTNNLDPKMDHFGELPFKCGLCGEMYANNSILLHHVKKKHGKIHFHPPYRCGLCKAKFFRNSYLIKHNKLHEKPKRTSGFRYTAFQNEMLST
ncbi:zinc finger protein 397-like [Planococcus citri]|uniref:zinc finger protein 397-like n=1 Tax=Planococcus citri TaxID=170843 RepID=UPI0031FA0917